MNRLAQLQADPNVVGRWLRCVRGHEVQPTRARGVAHGARVVGTTIQDLYQDAKLGPAVARPSEVSQVKRGAQMLRVRDGTNAKHTHAERAR